MLKIQRLANGKIIFILCGRMDKEQATALNKLFLNEPGEIQIVLDLKDLTLVDRDAIRFLERCEADGIEFRGTARRTFAYGLTESEATQDYGVKRAAFRTPFRRSKALVAPQPLYGLKRFLSILSDLIFDSRVDRGMPSLVAAPNGPNTRPAHSFKAASIICFS